MICNRRKKKGEESLDELLMERYHLAKERVCEITQEKVVAEPYLDFFVKTAVFLVKCIQIMDKNAIDLSIKIFSFITHLRL